MRHTNTWVAVLMAVLLVMNCTKAQNEQKVSAEKGVFNAAYYKKLKWRNIGPFRGGRSVAVTGHPNDPLTYFMGTTGGGLWKTEDAGLQWKNISDDFFATGSVGAIAISPSDPNIMYVGMGEHAVRGVMTSHGDGIYRSNDGGKTWRHLDLIDSRHIADIQVHPKNPDNLYVAVQGALYGPSEMRGIYHSEDGGQSWKRILYVNNTTGASSLSMDPHNPRILYAGMWDHQRTPWNIRSGGTGSGLYKSTDGGMTWQQLHNGLPADMGKVGIDVSPANPEIVYANIEAENGGVFRSDNSGKTWKQVNSQRVTFARAWYYIEIVADPVDPMTVYVLNAPLLKSIDGGQSFKPIANPHSDQHDLWINPKNTQNMILANDGGACISFNGGTTWSPQNNQPTAQFYRVIADNRFPYYVYGGQQDNSTMAIASRTTDAGIDEKDWYPVAGGESAFIAFDPDDPALVYGGSYQGNISVYDQTTGMTKDIMAYPNVGLSSLPSEMKYRFNWNAPIVAAPNNPQVIYHAANVVLKTTDGGISWEQISGDLTRNEKQKQGPGGGPYINEGAGGENYNTLSYLACSVHDPKVIWTGSDDGLVHITRDGGQNWENVTPSGLEESLINAIEVSPHDAATAYLSVNRYKWNDLQPIIYKTTDYGKSWQKIVEGLSGDSFVRVVKEDKKKKDLLYAGTENGLYISFNGGKFWHEFQSNLPMCPITDLTIQDNDLVAATSGRGFWILDDLGPLQQTMGGIVNGQPLLFQPKPSIRLLASGGSKAPANQGQNPPNGMIIDYYLPYTFDSTDLKLEIYNDAGELVRIYSNQKDDQFETYPGGPKAEKPLPAHHGINRFHWDLRRETLPAVPKVFVLGDYRGSLVAPGSYTLVLKGPDFELRQQATLLADPRLNSTEQDYLEQQQILVQIENAVQDIHESVNQMREIKDQLKFLNSILARMEDQKDLIDTGKVVIQKINQWEEDLIQPKQQTFQDVINYPNQLNAELLNLKSRVDTHDPRVTNGAKSRLQELLEQWHQHRLAMQDLISIDVTNYNNLYKSREIPALYVPASAEKP
ncbi:MAG: glycosyl hydrolase [Saprospiraceae bacterium]|nr:glycosyl hydrolase [Saprospiraceae bacterium]